MRYPGKAKDTLFLRPRKTGEQELFTRGADGGHQLSRARATPAPVTDPWKKEWDATGSVLWQQEQSGQGGVIRKWQSPGPRGTLQSRLSCVVFAFEPLAGLGYWCADARQVLLVSSLQHLVHFSTWGVVGGRF